MGFWTETKALGKELLTGEAPHEKAKALKGWAKSKTATAEIGQLDPKEVKKGLKREAAVVYKAAKVKAEAASKRAETEGSHTAHEDARKAHLEADARARTARDHGVRVDQSRSHVSQAQAHAFQRDKAKGDPSATAQRASTVQSNVKKSEAMAASERAMNAASNLARVKGETARMRGATVEQKKAAKDAHEKAAVVARDHERLHPGGRGADLAKTHESEAASPDWDEAKHPRDAGGKFS